MNYTKVLFLCTHNSARSQMAEGLLRAMGKGDYKVFSAGTEATFVRPLAITAMQEIGIDISKQRSKVLNEYLDQSFDYVITVCDQANESCPIFLGAKTRWHWSFPDPSKVVGSYSEQLTTYRKVRNAIATKLAQEFKLAYAPQSSNFVVEPATFDDLPQITALLASNHLPHEGLNERLATTLVMRYGNGEVVGSAALEIYGSAALLRSVVLAETLRGKGGGQILVENMIKLARQHGVKQLYLLTETAARFFSGFGFKPIKRNEVDLAVQKSLQFTTECATSGQSMTLSFLDD